MPTPAARAKAIPTASCGPPSNMSYQPVSSGPHRSGQIIVSVENAPDLRAKGRKGVIVGEARDGRSWSSDYRYLRCRGAEEKASKVDEGN